MEEEEEDKEDEDEEAATADDNSGEEEEEEEELPISQKRKPLIGLADLKLINPCAKHCLHTSICLLIPEVIQNTINHANLK